MSCITSIFMNGRFNYLCFCHYKKFVIFLQINNMENMSIVPSTVFSNTIIRIWLMVQHLSLQSMWHCNKMHIVNVININSYVVMEWWSDLNLEFKVDWEANWNCLSILFITICLYYFSVIFLAWTPQYTWK